MSELKPGPKMDFNSYRQAFFVHPPPEPRFRFKDSFGVTLFFEDLRAAVAFYGRVLGPPGYVEGEGTRGWPIGAGWLTLLRGRGGNPQNVEITWKPWQVIEEGNTVFESMTDAEFVSSGLIGTRMKLRLWTIIEWFRCAQR